MENKRELSWGRYSLGAESSIRVLMILGVWRKWRDWVSGLRESLILGLRLPTGLNSCLLGPVSVYQDETWLGVASGGSVTERKTQLVL